MVWLTGSNRNKLSGLCTTLDLESIVDLVEVATGTLNDRCSAMFRGQYVEDLGLGVGFGCAGCYACAREPLLGISIISRLSQS